MTGCKPLSQAEIKAISSTLSLRDLTLFTLGLKSGFRISELLSLKVQDVFKFGRVVEHVSVARKKMKGKAQGRTVRVHPEAQKLILALITEEGLEEKHYLFRSRKGANSPLGRIQAWRILRNAAQANEIEGKVATHSMRKSFAARVYEKLGHDLVKTQKALGHRNINSTVSYLSVADAEIDEAILGI